jgi:hypothetical protein
MEKKVTRWQASGLHLLISLVIALAVLTLLLQVWYPGPLFEGAGGSQLALILIGVDVVIGPLITLIVFRAGKRGMKFDLAVIAALQLAALVYGTHVMYLARPAFIVFVVDQFQAASAADLDPEELAKAKYPQFRQPPLGGPILAYAELPTDPTERADLMFLGLAGVDLERLPRLWAPYAERKADVLAKAWPLQRVRVLEPQAAKIVDEWMARSGTKEADVRYVRLRAKRGWIAVLLDAKTGEPLKMLLTEKI